MIGKNHKGSRGALHDQASTEGMILQQQRRQEQGAKTATDFYKSSPLNTPNVYVQDFYGDDDDAEAMDEYLNDRDNEGLHSADAAHQAFGSVSHMTMSDRVKLINQFQKPA